LSPIILLKRVQPIPNAKAGLSLSLFQENKMKLRIAALAAILLAAIILLAGCSKTTSNSNSTNTTNGNAGTSRSPSPTDAQPSPSATTSMPTTSSSGSGPTEVFQAYYEAIKAKDVNAIKSVFSKSMLAMMEDQAKRSNKSLDAVLAEGLEHAREDIPEAIPETRNEKIDGDTATLEVRDEKKDKWETIHFTKEDGAWKLSLDK
jgi:predicted lipid-binding transport protein (Tim44 family)